MKIYIMRHGEASMQAPTDAQRPLTLKGTQQSEQVGAWLASEGIYPQYFWVSPYLRAQQTYEHVAKQLFAEVTNNATVEQHDGITPSGNAIQISNKLRDLSQQDVGDLMIISHLPLVGYLVEALCHNEDAVMFNTADIACVELDQRLNGTLLWHGSLLTPPA